MVESGSRLESNARRSQRCKLKSDSSYRFRDGWPFYLIPNVFPMLCGWESRGFATDDAIAPWWLRPCFSLTDDLFDHNRPFKYRNNLYFYIYVYSLTTRYHTHLDDLLLAHQPAVRVTFLAFNVQPAMCPRNKGPWKLTPDFSWFGSSWIIWVFTERNIGLIVYRQSGWHGVRLISVNCSSTDWCLFWLLPDCTEWIRAHSLSHKHSSIV